MRTRTLLGFILSSSSALAFGSRAPAALPSFTAVDNPPRQEDGRYDIPRLKSLLSQLQVDDYLIGSLPQKSAQPNDFADFEERLLPETVGASFKLRYYLFGFNLPERLPYRHDAKQWVEKLAPLSVTYPQLQGVVLDDFFAPGESTSYLDASYLKDLCHRAHEINPQFKFSVVLYCKQSASINPAAARLSNRSNQEEVFADYLRAEPELRACIESAQVYPHPKYTRGSQAIADCVNEVHSAGVKAEVGVYIGHLNRFHMDLKRRLENLEDARGVRAEGYSLYVLPDPESKHELYGAKDLTEHSELEQLFTRLQSLLADKASFVHQ